MTVRVKHYFLLSLLGLTLLLSGCGDQTRLHQLQVYITQLKEAATHKKNAETRLLQLPKPVLYAPLGYSGSANRDNISSQGLMRNPLQAYPLKVLRFVGTLTRNNHISAYIMTPDNMVYQANSGDTIGDNDNKIVKINVDHIELSEKYIETGKKPVTRIVTMQLKE